MLLALDTFEYVDAEYHLRLCFPASFSYRVRPASRVLLQVVREDEITDPQFCVLSSRFSFSCTGFF